MRTKIFAQAVQQPFIVERIKVQRPAVPTQTLTRKAEGGLARAEGGEHSRAEQHTVLSVYGGQLRPVSAEAGTGILVLP